MSGTATKTLEGEVQKLFSQFQSAVKPNGSFDSVKKDLDRVGTAFQSMYTPKKVDDAKLEDAFNDASKLYFSILYNLTGEEGKKHLADGPELYGNLLRDWLGKVSEEAYGEARAAIKRGDTTELLNMFNKAYQAQANKLSSVVSKIQQQKSDTQLNVYKAIAEKLGGNLARVVGNPAAAARAYAQLLATQEAYKN